jgi:Holliday junction resolvasome RuvABC ATP-dependent DNA helicase subunit
VAEPDQVASAQVGFTEYPILAPEVRHQVILNHFKDIIANEEAKETLAIYLFDALGRASHVCPYNVAFYGPSSSGKTFMSKKTAAVLDIAYVEVNPKSVKTINRLYEEIVKVLADRGIKIEGDNIVLPPMIVFVDEAHGLSEQLEQALLKATEPKDRTLVTESGIKLDCRNVWWQLATTERGRLFHAFDTRFEPINLKLYTKEELVQIIHNKFPNYDLGICQLISNYYSRIPREAIRFAQRVKLTHNFAPGKWEQVVAKVAELKGIDPYGMTYQRLKILEALGRSPLTIGEMCIVAGCEEEELRKYVLPWLKESTPDQPPYIVAPHRHHLTEVGLAELDRRGISHQPKEEVLPKR